MAKSKERPLRKDAARNRQRILEAARELFAERGLSAGLNDIAHHAGVGVGTVYRHFPDRSKLVEGLFEERIDAIADLAERALADPDSWRGLVTFLEGALEQQAADRAFGELVLGAGEGFKRLAKARDRILPIVTQLVERARDAGELRADAEPHDMPVIQLMLAAVIDAAHQVDPDLWRRYLAIVLRGMRTEPGPAEPLPATALSFDRVDEILINAFAQRRR